MENSKILEQIKRDYKTAEEWILQYYERRAEYYEEARYIHDHSYGVGQGAGNKGSGGNNYSLIRFSDLEHMERWLLSVELMWSTLSPKKKIFVEQRRRAEAKNRYLKERKQGRINWALFVQKHYAREMLQENGGRQETYWMNEKTIKIWWKEIVELTRLIAQKRGCIF